MATTSTNERADPPDSGTGDRAAGDVDITRLADRVYRIMLAELRLARARGGMDQ